MYICNNCSRIFKEPTLKEFIEWHEAWGRKVPEHYTEVYCPKCGDEDFIEYKEEEIDED